VRLAESVDQATGLRRLFTPEPMFRALGVLGPDARGCARVAAAVSLGLGRRGERVLVLDEALPPHCVGALLGVLPRHSLADVPGRGLVDVVQPAADGVALLSAPNGRATLSGLSERDLRDMADDWRARQEAPEWLVLNGAGSCREAGLAATADVRLLVLPGAKARLADAYAAMKTAHGAWSGQTWWVLVEGADPEPAQSLFASLRETARRFLGIVPVFLGNLPRERPGASQSSLGADQVDALATGALNPPGAEGVNFERYWQRMWLYSRMTAEAVGNDGVGRDTAGKEAVTERMKNGRWISG
jgi:hypothetical protein